MSLLDSVDALGELVLSNLDKLLFSVVAVIVGYIFYKACMHEDGYSFLSSESFMRRILSGFLVNADLFSFSLLFES